MNGAMLTAWWKWRKLSVNNSMFRQITSVKNLRSKIVLVRVDFNVPLHKNKVVDASRIVASLPTINYLRKQGARIVLLAHLGRPEGKIVPTLSLKPVAKVLSTLLKQTVPLTSLATAPKAIARLKPGQVLMLENVRFLAGEEENKPAVAKQLASLGELFVFDGFAVAHRASASVSGIAQYLPAYAGLLMTEEITQLQKILTKPKHPFVAVIGGAKMETKLPVITSLLKSADKILVAGGIVNTMLMARGYGIGQSLCEKKLLSAAKILSKKAKIIMPIDLIVGDKTGKNWRVVTITKKASELCTKQEAIFDIGPATQALFAEHIQTAKTALWNGAVGWFEQPPYNLGTEAIAHALATATKTETICGGGETVEVLMAQKLEKKISFISTGGGAMLEFLSGKVLPGVKILEK